MTTPYTEMLQERVIELEKMNASLMKELEAAREVPVRIKVLDARIAELEAKLASYEQNMRGA